MFEYWFVVILDCLIQRGRALENGEPEFGDALHVDLDTLGICTALLCLVDLLDLGFRFVLFVILLLDVIRPCGFLLGRLIVAQDNRFSL